jgi:four helix bundle protein
MPMSTSKPLGQVKSYRDLVVWQKSKTLAVDIYKLTLSQPFERHRSLADQINRAAVSVPSNIAEGDERGTNKDSLRFLLIARGSLAELETQINIAKEIGLITAITLDQVAKRIEEVARLIGGTVKMRRARDVNLRQRF